MPLTNDVIYKSITWTDFKDFPKKSKPKLIVLRSIGNYQILITMSLRAWSMELIGI